MKILLKRSKQIIGRFQVGRSFRQLLVLVVSRPRGRDQMGDVAHRLVVPAVRDTGDRAHQFGQPRQVRRRRGRGAVGRALEEVADLDPQRLGDVKQPAEIRFTPSSYL